MKPPVFVVGCPRSGTSFLYHLMLSAGGFAEYRTQMNVFDVLEPIYGDLSVAKNRSAAVKEWLGSKGFKVSGLRADEIETKLLAECRGASDFLRIVMEEVALDQGVDRWIDSTPTNIPHMLRIQRDFPDAKFVHIIRDGRDVALSIDKRQWSRPLPWDRENSLLAAGIYWEWIVRKGRRYGAALGVNYMEVRYEDLVEHPAEALPRLSSFLQHDLNYDRIRQGQIGSIKTPLTSFKEELAQGQFNPVGRWKGMFSVKQLEGFEDLVGPYLRELGYPLCAAKRDRHPISARRKRSMYQAFYECKQWAKVNTPLSRVLVDYSAILIDK